MMLLQILSAQISRTLHQVNGRCLPALTNLHLPLKALEIHSVSWITVTMLALTQSPQYLGHITHLTNLLGILPHAQGSRHPIHKQGTFRKARASSQILPCQLTPTAMYIEEDIQTELARLQPNHLLQQTSEACMVGMAIAEMVLFKHLGFVTCNGLHLVVLAGARWLWLAAALNIASCSFYFK
jgi:hypothetical protein